MRDRSIQGEIEAFKKRPLSFIISTRPLVPLGAHVSAVALSSTKPKRQATEMSVAQYGRQFPILLRMSNPRGHVELLETIGKGNYGYVYKVP